MNRKIELLYKTNIPKIKKKRRQRKLIGYIFGRVKEKKTLMH